MIEIDWEDIEEFVYQTQDTKPFDLESAIVKITGVTIVIHPLVKHNSVCYDFYCDGNLVGSVKILPMEWKVYGNGILIDGLASVMRAMCKAIQKYTREKVNESFDGIFGSD